MNYELRDKVIIITGTGKGFGHDLAKRCCAEGANVACITRSEEDILSFKEEMSFDATRFYSMTGDVADQNTAIEFVEDVRKKFGRVDGLVNNAGMRFRKSFSEVTLEEWEAVLRNNLTSVFLLCREVGRIMCRQQTGVILNMASIVGTLGLPELAVYGASKGGILSLTKSLAVEWAKHGVRVNALSPGFCETSYADAFKKKKELYAFTLERTPLGKWGTSKDVSELCLFLLSDAAAYITGEIINIDGGWSAW